MCVNILNLMHGRNCGRVHKPPCPLLSASLKTFDKINNEKTFLGAEMPTSAPPPPFPE